MKELIDELKHYIDTDKIINDLYCFLLVNIEKNLSIIEIESLIDILNKYLMMIRNLDQISTRKKNKILNILNEVIIHYNESLMNEICKQI